MMNDLAAAQVFVVGLTLVVTGVIRAADCTAPRRIGQPLLSGLARAGRGRDGGPSWPSSCSRRY